MSSLLGAKIVVTFDWRKSSSVQKLNEMVKNWGIAGDVIGKTPYMEGAGRCDEIKEFLKSQSNIINFAVIDDNRLLFNDKRFDEKLIFVKDPIGRYY